MSSITNIEKIKLEKLFDMSSGYVADFSNRTFSDFIFTETSKQIMDERYNAGSGSKANRLRSFWEKESDTLVGKLTMGMLEYWKTKKLIEDIPIKANEQVLFDECKKIADRLCGKTASTGNPIITEDDFITKEFKGVSIDNLGLDTAITPVLKQRFEEIGKCLMNQAALSVIFLCGSTLEGILLGMTSKYPRAFNQSPSAPTKDGKVLQFHQWTLSNLIDVSCNIGLLGEDVKKFSHSLRGFRNYIHPYEQMSCGFSPHEHTAKISWQVLQAAIYEIGKYTNSSAIA